MIPGLERFRDHFRGFEESYVLIGGVATHLHLEDVGLPFRTTKDLDIVLCVEALDEAFVERLWSFVKLAGYEMQEQGTRPRRYYRFQRPRNPAFPVMLELFSRKLDDVLLHHDAHLTPVPTSEDLSSLSAILIDDDLYRWLVSGRRLTRGIAVASVDHLIGLKVRAYLDLHRRRSSGESVDGRAVKKHRSDVLRLLQLVTDQPLEGVPTAIRNDVMRFATIVRDEAPDVKGLQLPFSNLTQPLALLERRYGGRE